MIFAPKYPTCEVVDLFCGAGGESTGISHALGDSGIDARVSVVNHWDLALETLIANHPDFIPHQENINELSPNKVVPGQVIDLLWASPEGCGRDQTKQIGNSVPVETSRALVRSNFENWKKMLCV